MLETYGNILSVYRLLLTNRIRFDEKFNLIGFNKIRFKPVLKFGII